MEYEVRYYTNFKDEYLLALDFLLCCLKRQPALYYDRGLLSLTRTFPLSDKEHVIAHAARVSQFTSLASFHYPSSVET